MHILAKNMRIIMNAAKKGPHSSATGNFSKNTFKHGFIDSGGGCAAILLGDLSVPATER
jgi:hypothetical protein